MLKAGFDIGGTNLRGALWRFDPSKGESLADEPVVRVAGPNPHDAEALVDQLVAHVHTLAQQAGEPIEAIGVAIAGLVDLDGVVRYSPNIVEIVEFDLRSALDERLDAPVVVHNDANAALWAEHRRGAAEGFDDVVSVGLGTGIGSAIVLGGRLQLGAHGFAGEAGHMVIDVDGESHHTGVRGPWERYGSGTALRERFAAADDIDGSPETGPPDEAEIAARVGRSEPAALKILNDYADWVGLGVANLVALLDPAAVVIVGGVARLGEPLCNAVDKVVQRHSIGVGHRPSVDIVIGRFAELGGAYGAAMLAGETIQAPPP
jgi:glucokinase